MGDSVTFGGTLIKGGGAPDYTSAHTIEANIGIYTMPGTQPSYLPSASSVSAPPTPTPSRSTGWPSS